MGISYAEDHIMMNDHGNADPRVQASAPPARKDNQSYYDEFSDWYERDRHRGYHTFIDHLEADAVLRHVTPESQVLEAESAIAAARSQLSQTANKSLSTKDIGLVDSMLGINSTEAQMAGVGRN